MASRREQVLQAAAALLVAALPFGEVRRNADKPEAIPPGGMIILRDGDPGEPEVDLSPLAYNYEHRIPLELATYASDAESREEALDLLLAAIGAAVLADRTLGGLVDFLDAEAPVTDDLETPGAETGRWAAAALVASYRTDSPL